jgi:hypothetical protein
MHSHCHEPLQRAPLAWMHIADPDQQPCGLPQQQGASANACTELLTAPCAQRPAHLQLRPVRTRPLAVCHACAPVCPACWSWEHCGRAAARCGWCSGAAVHALCGWARRPQLLALAMHCKWAPPVVQQVTGSRLTKPPSGTHAFVCMCVPFAMLCHRDSRDSTLTCTTSNLQHRGSTSQPAPSHTHIGTVPQMITLTESCRHPQCARGSAASLPSQSHSEIPSQLLTPDPCPLHPSSHTM